jgi:hypothetical protein
MIRSTADIALSPLFTLPSPLDTITIDASPRLLRGATDLHGYIARPTGNNDWIFTDPGDLKHGLPRAAFSTAC